MTYKQHRWYQQWLEEHCSKESMAAYKAWDTMREKPMEQMDLELSPMDRAIKECIDDCRRSD